MTYIPIYTDANRVKDFFKDIDTGLTDAKINEHIQRAEGMIFASSQGKVNISFDNFDPTTKRGHAFIQGLATKIAAFSTLSYYPGNTDTNSQAALIGDTLYSEILLDLKYIRDKRFLNSIDLTTSTKSSNNLLSTTNIIGSNLSGNDGDTDRTYEVLKAPSMIFVDGIYLHFDTDYSMSGLTIIFTNQIWNEQKIAIVI